jgi:transcriptional/translational regulatory protein YebC/TACO1
MDTAVEAGAEDYERTASEWLVYCPIERFDEVSRALEASGIEAKSSKLAYVPKIRKEVRGRDAEVCLNLVDALDEHDDVANVFADFEIPEDEMNRIAELDG